MSIIFTKTTTDAYKTFSNYIGLEKIFKLRKKKPHKWKECVQGEKLVRTLELTELWQQTRPTSSPSVPFSSKSTCMQSLHSG